MIITSIKFSPYRIPFKNPFKTASGEYSVREGIIIEIHYGKFHGFGESAPLTGFSHETLIESRNCLEGFALAINGVEDDQSLEDLLLLARVHSFDHPSVLFGLESAIYDLYPNSFSEIIIGNQNWKNPKKYSHFLNEKNTCWLGIADGSVLYIFDLS